MSGDLDDVEGPRYVGCNGCGEAYDVEGDDFPDECPACLEGIKDEADDQ
jgi:hypothetical protein